MKTNESGLDRVIRVAAGLILVTLYATGIAQGGFGIVSFILGGILIVTGVFGFCPLYDLFKFQTKKK